jgi:hypothetical protein
MSDTFLEELKSMGRMDGDMIDCADEARTIEGWRQECERLRGRVAQLETQLKAGRQCVAERDEEIERLKADRCGAAIAGENEALRIIIRHLAKLL